MAEKETDPYLATVDRMEPDTVAVDLTAAAASIAISLKRIADVLCELDARDRERFMIQVNRR